MYLRNVRLAQRLHERRFVHGLHKERFFPSTRKAITNTRHEPFSTTNKTQQPRRNERLEEVKDHGLSVLESITKDLKMKTRQHLFFHEDEMGPTVTQVQEANRLRDLMEEVVQQYVSKRDNLFCVGGDPIVIVDVEVTEDVRQARVYWSLPFRVLTMKRLNREKRDLIANRMQEILDKRGGVLQGMLHAHLRFYRRPPSIRFVQAESEILRKVILGEM